MTDCTSKVTTVTETDEVVARGTEYVYWWPEAIPDGVAVIRRGDRLVRLDLHPLTCLRDGPPHTEAHVVDEPFLEWDDGTPGATPHTPPADVCPDCDDGISYSIDGAPNPCYSCGGTGDVCPDCDGHGVIGSPKRACPFCRGTGDRPAITFQNDDALRSPHGLSIERRPAVTDDALDAAVGACYRFLDPLTRERMPSEQIAEMLLAALGAAAATRHEAR